METHLEASVVEVPNHAYLRHLLDDAGLELPLGLKRAPQSLEDVRHHHFVFTHGYGYMCNCKACGMQNKKEQFFATCCAANVVTVSL